VGDVNLLERSEGGEVLEFDDSVGLDGENFEGGEGGDVLLRVKEEVRGG